MYHYFGPLSLMYCDLQIFMALNFILFHFIVLSSVASRSTLIIPCSLVYPK